MLTWIERKIIERRMRKVGRLTETDKQILGRLDQERRAALVRMAKNEADGHYQGLERPDRDERFCTFARGAAYGARQMGVALMVMARDEARRIERIQQGVKPKPKRGAKGEDADGS